MAEHTNPPAFPNHPRTFIDGGTGRPELWTGMTLRDWFAGQALSNPAICTGKADEFWLRRWFRDRGGIMPWEIAAKQAGEYADAMLAARTGDT
jgi:hypothetical protein